MGERTVTIRVLLLLVVLSTTAFAERAKPTHRAAHAGVTSRPSAAVRSIPRWWGRDPRSIRPGLKQAALGKMNPRPWQEGRTYAARIYDALQSVLPTNLRPLATRDKLGVQTSNVYDQYIAGAAHAITDVTGLAHAQSLRVLEKASNDFRTQPLKSGGPSPIRRFAHSIATVHPGTSRAQTDQQYVDAIEAALRSRWETAP